MVIENDFNEFFQDFLAESTELIQDYETNLLEIESQFKSSDFAFQNIEENLQAIFRSVHTIKGLAGMMDFQDINYYTHEAEEVLDCLRNRQILLDEPLIEMMFTILDNIKSLMTDLLAPGSIEFDMDEEISKLVQFLKESTTAAAACEPVSEEENGSVGPEREIVQNANFSSNTIRVDTQRLDMLLDIVGELVISKNQLIEVSRPINNTPLIKTLKNHRRLIVELQEWSMKLRMVPIGYTLNRFNRLVRDLGKESGKEVRYVIEGEATEVDRAIMECLEDPLLHIIRNSIDHGIEVPEIREGLMKDPIGTLKISAYQESGAIIIKIQDDGKGIDTEKVFAKAVERGLVDANAKLSKNEILNLIFTPGFSTVDEITDVSGRGVGMDVVRKNVLSLNGMITIDSTIDKGTQVMLKVPLTLAIIRAMLVKVGEEFFSIPIYNIIETLSVSASEVYNVNGYEAAHIRHSAIPLIRLNEFMGIKSTGEKSEDKMYVIVAGIGEKQVGFVVDELIDQLDIVIKKMGVFMENIPGVSGATILGNGQISLVLDFVSIWHDFYESINKHN